MNKIANIIIITICLAMNGIVYAEDLYFVSSKEMGVTSFDYTVREIDRKPRHSKIVIRNFEARSAVASRWMMCAYNDLAIQRGFDYWAVYYPDKVKDQLLIIFPESDSENDPIIREVGQGKSKPIIGDIRTFAHMCGMKIK